ncbi:hypothetical protein KIH27_00585 [Mycobacterium sp. M1]|uniref:RNA polymerase sigma-70 ECF-like HTH domain-containing protein n=1 Tax=Mycolicibacter acidiphilus TaxID=2835306 RepID=A0ABS5RCR1_9MYCO|nr:ECF-type sigma factor [Mycolicibacter acidiphilus]MBS9532078.1 hypothetical protein [Mycolicibacter acidiphilus]
MTVISQQLTDDVPPMAEADARKLDMRIRNLATQVGGQLVTIGRLLDEARAGQIHRTLGYPSWPAYVADALGGHLELSSDARLDVVELMAGAGMSVRAIAEATGASKSTVQRDMQVSRNGTPATADVVRDAPEQMATTGVDGKTYPRKPKAPKKPPPSDTKRRRRYREDMTRKAFAAADAVEKLSRHASGDQFTDYASRPTVAARNVRKRLQRSVDYLQELLARLPETRHADNPD